MVAYVLPNPKQQYFTPAGIPLVGGKLYTYAVGTSTPKASYADSAMVSPNANPVILDSRGEALIYWSGLYRIELRDSLNGLVYAVDNYGAESVITAIDGVFTTLAQSDGSSKIGFIQAETGGVQKTVRDKLRQIIAQEDFNTLANFNSAIDLGDKPALYDNGKLVSYAAKSASNTYGTFDNACVLSVQANQGRRPAAQVLGFVSDADVSLYSDRDSVGIFADNLSTPPTITVAPGAATYTATTLTAAAINPAVIKPGMIVDTTVDPALTVKWSGVVTGAIGNIVTVSAWYPVNASMVPGTPPNTLGAFVNPTTKIWAANFNILIRPDSYAIDATGLEIGVVNTKGLGLGVAFDAVCMGTSPGSVAYRARGLSAGFGLGFQAENCRISYAAASVIAGDIGFYSATASVNTTGFVAQGETIAFESVGTLAGGASFRVSNNSRTAVLWDVNANGQHGAFTTAVKTAAVSTTIDTLNYTVVLIGTTAAQVLTPISAAGIPGRTYEIVNKSTQTWTISGVTTVATNITVVIKSDGTNWAIVSRVGNT